MNDLTFNDLLAKAKIDPKRVVMIRHALSHSNFKNCYEYDDGDRDEMIRIYTSIQKKSFKQGDYFAVFISSGSSSATFYCLYKVKGVKSFNSLDIPKEYFGLVKEDLSHTEHTAVIFDLEKDESLFASYYNRLVINWGVCTPSNWAQRAYDRDKAIVALRDALEFPGYDEVILDYKKLNEIIKDQDLYQAWHKALSSVYGVYLILDKATGKQYVGSAYGDIGILGRWQSYTSTKGTGGNEGLKALLEETPEAYKNFQYSILQILPKNVTDKEAVRIENRFKDKLGSRDWGYNQN